MMAIFFGYVLMSLGGVIAAWNFYLAVVGVMRIVRPLPLEENIAPIPLLGSGLIFAGWWLADAPSGLPAILLVIDSGGPIGAPMAFALMYLATLLARGAR